MGLFDLLGVSDKKIHRSNFKRALRQISNLSPKERAYVEEVFKDDLKDGLSAFEVKERCGKIMHKIGDPLEPEEVRKIKEKLLKYVE